ncbi:MAG: HDOD domain-containing protein [Acidobacteriia bacterium]|nr:HDOD domain-containing protein [Terriglobia bacterium]
MQVREQIHPSALTFVEMTTPERQQRRKARLMSILTEGLPTLPSFVFELNTLLSSPSVDLKRVAKVIRNDPSISAQVLRMCNSALFSLRRRVLSIEEAAVLMGSERLRTLVLTCSMMEFTGRQLPRGEVQAYWQHSFMSGMLSERVAKWLEYSEREQAYLGGLLHDIGMLPLLVVVAEEHALRGDTVSGPWGGSLEAEKGDFGLNHCEVGRWIGQSWNFFPSFIDVFENHHHPERSSRDPHLVGIVSAADHFCEAHSLASPSDGETQELSDPAAEDEFLARCLPRLEAKERSELTEMLETEYLHLLPVIEFNNPTEQPTAGRTALI